MFNHFPMAPFDVPDPCALTPADHWQAVARNLAEVVAGAARYARGEGDDAYALELERTFARVCAAHGLTA